MNVGIFPSQVPYGNLSRHSSCKSVMVDEMCYESISSTELSNKTACSAKSNENVLTFERIRVNQQKRTASKNLPAKLFTNDEICTNRLVCLSQ